MKQYITGETSLKSPAIERYRKAKAEKLDNASTSNEQNDGFWTIEDLGENAVAFIFAVLFVFGSFFIVPFIGLFIN